MTLRQIVDLTSDRIALDGRVLVLAVNLTGVSKQAAGKTVDRPDALGYVAHR